MDAAAYITHLTSQRALIQEVIYRFGVMLGLTESLRKQEKTPQWSAELGIRLVVKFYLVIHSANYFEWPFHKVVHVYLCSP